MSLALVGLFPIVRALFEVARRSLVCWSEQRSDLFDSAGTGQRELEVKPRRFWASTQRDTSSLVVAVVVQEQAHFLFGREVYPYGARI